MSSRASSERVENKLKSAVNGQIVMNLGHDTTSEKSKVDFIYGAVPSRSKHDILLVLQSCDYNVETAISIFSQGQEEEVLKQWSCKGKRSKQDGNKKKRNKKKQNNKDIKESPQTENSIATKSTSETTSIHDQTSQTLPGPALSLNLSSDIPSPSPVENGISSPDSSSNSSPEILMSTKPPSRSSNHSSHQPKHAGKHTIPKPEKLSPTSHADALKKSTKDLTRSSFSLARYQVVLEEECEQSFKRITKTFENVRKCINEREEFLTKALKDFKEQGDKLLQQRLEDAAALRLKTERVQSMPDEQVVLLRADIKSFVAERKIDEELAQTKRFVCDEEKLIQELKTFGQVVPIKGTYTPVVLNHYITSSVSKPKSIAPEKQLVSTSLPPSSSTSKQTASTVKSSTEQISIAPTNKSNVSSDIKSSSNHPFSSLDKQLTPKQTPVSNKLSSQTMNNGFDNPPKNSTFKHANESLQQGETQDASLPQHHKGNEAQHKKHTKPSSKTTSKQPSPANTTSHNQTVGKGSTSSSNIHVESQAKMSAISTTNGPPPKISTLISMAMAKSSAVVSGEDATNVVNLQEVVHARGSEHKRGNQAKGQTRSQQNRPNTTPLAQGKQQKNHEPRPRRPQSSRQQREDKENKGRQNQVHVGKEQHNPKQERQSEQSQDGKRKRQRRRGGRDRKPKDSDGVVEENVKDDRIPMKSEVPVQQDEIIVTNDAANQNPEPEVSSPTDIKEENLLTVVNTNNTSDSVETEISGQEVSIEKENVDSNSQNDSSLKEVNGTSNHKDETEVQRNTSEDHETKPNEINSDNVGESDEIPSTALPQRSPRSQGRRRNRNADENKESSSVHDLNGSTNGINHNSSDDADNTEKSVVETSDLKEDSVTSKPSQVATPSLINGHDKWLESEPIKLEINQEKELENQSEIDGQQASNGTGEECLVER